MRMIRTFTTSGRRRPFGEWGPPVRERHVSARDKEVARDACIGAAAGAVLGGVTGNNPVGGGAVGGAYGAHETRDD